MRLDTDIFDRRKDESSYAFEDVNSSIAIEYVSQDKGYGFFE